MAMIFFSEVAVRAGNDSDVGAENVVAGTEIISKS